MRRGSMRCPLRKRLASWAVCLRPFFSRSSAASFCCAFGPAADALPWRDDLKPPRSRPSRAPFPLLLLAISRFHDASASFHHFLDLLASSFPERLVRRDDRLRRLSRIVGHEHKVEIPFRDLSLAQHARLKPAQQAGPVIPSEKNNGEAIDLPRLN